LTIKTLSTFEVARQAGVHPGTLKRWLALGKLREPKVLVIGGRVVRLWKEADIERVRRYKARKCAEAPDQPNHRTSYLEAGDHQLV